MLKPRIERILFERKEAGRRITQTEIAQKLGVTKQQVNQWVTGKSYPRCEKLFELAALLECKVDDLYERVDDDK